MSVVTRVGRLGGPMVMTVTCERVSMIPSGSSGIPSKGWFALPGRHCEYHGLLRRRLCQHLMLSSAGEASRRTGVRRRTSQSCRRYPLDSSLALRRPIHYLGPSSAPERPGRTALAEHGPGCSHCAQVAAVPWGFWAPPFPFCASPVEAASTKTGSRIRNMMAESLCQPGCCSQQPQGTLEIQVGGIGGGEVYISSFQ